MLVLFLVLLNNLRIFKGFFVIIIIFLFKQYFVSTFALRADAHLESRVYVQGILEGADALLKLNVVILLRILITIKCGIALFDDSEGFNPWY